MRISPAPLEPCVALPGLPSGIYPYLGGSVSVADLRIAVREHGNVTVPGLNGVKLAGKAENTLADPAQYTHGLPDEAKPIRGCSGTTSGSNGKGRHMFPWS